MPLQPLKFNITFSLGTLAANSAISSPTIDSLDQDFNVVSTDLLLSLSEFTAGEGPIDVGLSQQGYTNSEIAECLDASPLSQYGPEMERSKRKVRLYGRFSGEATDESLNDGLMIRRKMFLRAFGVSNFAVARVFAMNRDASALTTGALIEAQGTHWGRWQ